MKGVVAGMVFCVVTIVLAAANRVSAVDHPIRLGKYRQLFVDDYIIAEMRGVKRVIHKAKRHPANPLLVPEHPWEGVDLYVYGSVLYVENEKLFKMWYTSWGVNGMWGCYATSADGIHWKKPELGLVEFMGAKANNIIDFKGWNYQGVIHSPDDPDPNRRYKALSRRRGAFSADGLIWRVSGESRDIPGDIEGDNVIPNCYDELSGRYIAFPKVVRQSGKHLRRSVSVSFSKDFLQWTKAETILVPDARDDERSLQRTTALRDRVMFFEQDASLRVAQFYGMCGFPYEGMYLGLLWVLDISGWKPGYKKIAGIGGEDGPNQIELVSSRDLHRWNRVADRELVIPVGAKDSWEAGMIYTVNRPIIVGDQIWIYYGGMGHTHGHPMYQEVTEAVGIKSGIGLATLRLDGWVSIDAGKGEGLLTTKPLRISGKRLVINAECDDDGYVAVEVLDVDGKPVDGFTPSGGDRFTGDSVRHVVKWEDNPNIASLNGKDVRLRFYINSARLYSFGIKP